MFIFSRKLFANKHSGSIFEAERNQLLDSSHYEIMEPFSRSILSLHAIMLNKIMNGIQK